MPQAPSECGFGLKTGAANAGPATSITPSPPSQQRRQSSTHHATSFSIACWAHVRNRLRSGPVNWTTVERNLTRLSTEWCPGPPAPWAKTRRTPPPVLRRRSSPSTLDIVQDDEAVLLALTYPEGAVASQQEEGYASSHAWFHCCMQGTFLLCSPCAARTKTGPLPGPLYHAIAGCATGSPRP